MLNAGMTLAGVPLGSGWLNDVGNFSIASNRLIAADKSGWNVATYEELRNILQEKLYAVTADNPYDNEFKGALDALIRRVDAWKNHLIAEYTQQAREALLGIAVGAVNP